MAPRVGAHWGGCAFQRPCSDSEPTPAIRPELVIDARHLRHNGRLEQRLREVMDRYPKTSSRKATRGTATRSSRPRRRHEEPLGVRADGVERAIAKSAPSSIEWYLKHRRRLAVSGPAGSGKTLLALERAREAARSGNETLLLTYNRPLADHLAAQTRGVARLTVCNFHQLCRGLASQAGLAIPSQERDFYAQASPLALDAIDRIGGQFDAILVDEGQVMEEDWWIVIEASLRSQDDGLLWVFYDDNQALYRRPRGLPDGMDSQPLYESWRNSRQIFDEAMQYYEGGSVECLGPDGPRSSLSR